MKGRVTNIVRREGKGGGYFFVRDEEDRDRFAHANDLRDYDFADLREGDKVAFEPAQHPTKGPRAERVRVAK